MYTDVFLGFLIILFATWGFANGFLQQVISLLTWLFVLFASFPVATALSTQAHLEAIPALIIWLSVVVSAFLVSALVRFLVSKMMKATALRLPNRWAGFALGAVKGAVFAIFLAVSFEMIPYEIQPIELREDKSESHFIDASHEILSWDVISIFQELDQYRKVLEEKKSFLDLENNSVWRLRTDRDTN